LIVAALLHDPLDVFEHGLAIVELCQPIVGGLEHEIGR